MNKKLIVADDTTLVITTYNNPPFLELVLKGVLRQQVMPCEVLSRPAYSLMDSRRRLSGGQVTQCSYLQSTRRIHHHHRWRHCHLPIIRKRPCCSSRARLFYQWKSLPTDGKGYSQALRLVRPPFLCLHYRLETPYEPASYPLVTPFG